MKRLNVHIEDELHAQFKIYCAIHRLSLTDMVKKWIVLAVQKTAKPKGKTK